jgi:hypothetical protein
MANPSGCRRAKSDATVPTSPYGSSKLMTERRQRPRPAPRDLALLQRRRPTRSVVPASQPKEPLTSSRSQSKPRSACGQKWMSSAPTIRPRRHLHPGLYSRLRSRARAFRCADLSARGWRLCHAQLRLRAWFLRARSGLAHFWRAQADFQFDVEQDVTVEVISAVAAALLDQPIVRRISFRRTVS